MTREVELTKEQKKAIKRDLDNEMEFAKAYGKFTLELGKKTGVDD